MSDQVEIEVVEDEGGGPVRPVYILDEEETEKVMSWLKAEYDSASSEMDARNQKVAKWRRNMEAVASDAPKNHPYKNSSNVVVPVTQMIGQTLFAKAKGTFDAREPLWTVEGWKKDEEEIRRYKVLEKYLNMLARSPTDLDMDRVLSDWIMEVITTGGAFPKVSYSVESWRVRSSDGKSEREVVNHDGPLVTIVPIEKVKYRRGIGDINRLPWISVDLALTKTELEERASKGIYDLEAVMAILDSPRTSPTELEEVAQRSETFDSGETTPIFDVSEVWFKWDVDGNGVPVDLFFTVHFPSGRVLRQQYNTLGTRFITASRYVHRPYALTGRGVGQMTEAMQDEITANHNMRNDNMKIANTRMLVVRKGVGFGAKREVFPGAVWEAEEPERDVRAFQLGEVYPSSLQAEMNSMQYAQRSVGLSDNQMGFADSVMRSRDSVRGSAMRLEQGDSILASILEGMRKSLGEVGMLVWMQCVANKERVIARERVAMRLTEEELAILEELLNMELTDVPMRLAFTVRTTDAERTYDQQRQTLLALTQVYSQFSQQTIPLAMQVFGPQGMQMKQQAPEMWAYMARILTGSGKLMEDVFKFSGLFNTKDYVPDMDAMDKILDMMRGVAQALSGAPQIESQMGMGMNTGMAEGQMIQNGGGEV